MTWKWENYDRIFIFLVDYPFKTELDGINEMEWD